MAMQYFNKENMSKENTNNTNTTAKCCKCITSSLQTLTSSETKTTTTATTTTATQTTNNLKFQKSNILREIVGNSKEMKIENNTHNLRIVGNNNRIRISVNVGDITIIGNNTRLKIGTNHGNIKYTGNDGRISLGRASTEQLVDYSGCNGILKVQNSKKSNDDLNKINSNTSINAKSNNNNKSQQKCSSYSGLPEYSEFLQCRMDYSNIFDRKNSMPNMATKQFSNENASNNRDHRLPKTVVNKIGNIVITNSSNICISPLSYN